MKDIYHIRIEKLSRQLAANAELMDIYAKYEITARDEIPESLLYGDSMKILDRAVQKLNDAYGKGA